MATRAPPGRTYSEQCERLFGTEDDSDAVAAASLHRTSSNSRRFSALSTPVSLWSDDTTFETDDDRRSFASTTSSYTPTSYSSSWRRALSGVGAVAGLVLVAYCAGSHFASRDLQVELRRQAEAQEALEAAQRALLQETQQLQELQNQQERLESKLSSLTSELHRKQESLQQESQRAAQREHEMEQVKASMSSGNILTGADMGLGASNPTTAATDELVTKLVQSIGYEQYGLRPRRVEIHIAYKNEHNQEERHYFIGELSMLFSPISAFTFLSQVEHGLYNHVELQLETGSSAEYEGYGASDSASFLVASPSDLQWRERELLGLARVPVQVEGVGSSESTESELHKNRYRLGFDEDGTLFVTPTSTFRHFPQASWFASVTAGDEILDEVFQGLTESMEIVSIHVLSETEHVHVDEPIHGSSDHPGHDHEQHEDRYDSLQSTNAHLDFEDHEDELEQ